MKRLGYILALVLIYAVLVLNFIHWYQPVPPEENPIGLEEFP